MGRLGTDSPVSAPDITSRTRRKSEGVVRESDPPQMPALVPICIKVSTCTGMNHDTHSCTDFLPGAKPM